MKNSQTKEFCLRLLKADSEESIKTLLKDYGYWDNEEVWRNYGDFEGNYRDAGNQASEPEAALVEKLTNSRDSRLMKKCLIRGINPEGSDAPSSLNEAVAEFYEDNPKGQFAGQIKEWSPKKRTEIARGVTLSVTGFKPKEGYPCLTIADQGEGQTPDGMPETILSLQKSIKLKIPFVHGKFNMGGTAVLRFCGKENFQLVISKRSPEILNNPSDDDKMWGFTIVRRIYAADRSVRGSVYRYLAPLNADKNPMKGSILRFESEGLPILPKSNVAYSQEATYGTCIKLYEYKTKNKQSMFRDGGMYRPLDLLLPDIGLPVRLHECRDYKGHKGSFEKTLNGLKVTLFDDRTDNLEPGFPSTVPLRVGGNDLNITIYAFKKDRCSTYRQKDKGILFTLNGQTQGWLHERHFGYKAVGMQAIKDSLIVLVECSELDPTSRENLFMNSRDRLSEEDIRYDIEEKLKALLREHEGLKNLRSKRINETRSEKLSNSKPIENVLKTVFSHSPTLSRIFMKGQQLSNPYKKGKKVAKDEDYEGKEYPTFFKFKKVDYGKTFKRDCPINNRCRIQFETDAENDYFGRKTNKGDFKLYYVHGENKLELEDYTPNLFNGILNLSLDLPGNCKVGDSLRFMAMVNDPSRIIEPPYENTFVLNITEPSDPKKPTPPRPKTVTGISFPPIVEVYNEKKKEDSIEWSDVPGGGHFDKYSALRIVNAGEETDDGKLVYNFYVNMDNIYLNTEMSCDLGKADLIASQFKFALVLIGLAMIHEDNESHAFSQNGEQDDREEDSSITLEDSIEEVTRSISLMILPIIRELGELSIEPELMAVE